MELIFDGQASGRESEHKYDTSLSSLSRLNPEAYLECDVVYSHLAHGNSSCSPALAFPCVPTVSGELANI